MCYETVCLLKVSSMMQDLQQACEMHSMMIPCQNKLSGLPDEFR